MKRCFAKCCALMAAVIAVGTLVLCMAAPHALVWVLGDSAEASRCVADFFASAGAGDLEGVEKQLLDQPRLSDGYVFQQPVTQELWDAYCASLEYTCEGGFYPGDNGLACDVVVTALDMEALIPLTEQRYVSLLERWEGQEEADTAQVLETALRQLLAEGAPQTRKTVTLHLSHQNGQWRIEPDKAVLALLSGGMY